jgi:hypothetical protein
LGGVERDIDDGKDRKQAARRYEGHSEVTG